MKKQQIHSFPPVIHSDSEILILGSFPSVVSRDRSFYYMYPQNRFWKLLANIYDDAFEMDDIMAKKALLKKYKIAIYDVIESCFISGSSDASITDVIPADINKLIENSQIKKIFLNGSKAKELFLKYHKNLMSIAHPLPSTSSANAGYDLHRLYEKWKVIKI